MLTFSSGKDDRILTEAMDDGLGEASRPGLEVRREPRTYALNELYAPHAAVRTAVSALGRLGVVAIWIWSMVELPAELSFDASIVQTFALALSKLCLTVLAGMVLMGNTIARRIFLLVCWLSILAIAPGLTLQFHYDRTGFFLSAIECLLKGLTIIAFALPGLDYKVGLGERARFDGHR